MRLQSCDHSFYILKNMEKMPYQATNAAFRKLERVMKRLSLTHEEHKIYERSLRHYLDNYNCMKSAQEESFQEGMEKGEKKGEQKGILKGVMQTARNMKNKGCSIDLIMDVTGLTADEIAKL